MNNLRRKQLNDLLDQFQALNEELKTLMGEEEDYLDNMPENMQGSERYEKADEACGNLQEAIDSINSSIEYIEAAVE